MCALSNCDVDGCPKPVQARRMCWAHYRRWLRHGTIKVPTEEQAFWARVRRTSGCWLWTGATRSGYGQWRGQQAHRVAYALLVGPLPPGVRLRHACGVRACVRPAHVTAKRRGR